MPTITVRLGERNMADLDVIKKDTARYFNMSPEDISNSQAIKYAIGFLSESIENINKTTS